MKPYNLRTKGALQCGHCDEWFLSLALWKRHRLGPWDARRCAAPIEMRQLEMRRDTKGRWKQRDNAEYDYNRRHKP